MGISGFIHLDPSNYITKWVFIHLTQIFKWVGLRLTQIKWVMGGFMDMDKICHPYWWGYIDEQSGGTWWNIYCVKSDSLIYNIMAKMAMKDKKTESSRETTAAALRRLWSYGSHLIWIHVVKQVSFSFLFGVQNAIEFSFGIDRFIYIYIYIYI